MKWPYYVVLAVVLCILATGTAHAGALNRTGGMGPRAGGMSGAYAALADDASLFFYNVAGLSQFDETYVEVGNEILYPYFKHEDHYGRVQHSRSPIVHVLPLVGYAYPVSERLVVGLGVTTPFGMGARFKNNFQQFGYDTDTLISLTNLTPAVSYKLTDHLALGAGLNIGYGQFKFYAPLSLASAVTPFKT